MTFPSDVNNTSGVPKTHVEQTINRSDLEFHRMGDKTTVCVATLPNGFEVVVSAAPVDVADYDDEMGRELCEERLKERVWELLGFQRHGQINFTG
jgi:hypothetical protein